MHTLRVGRSVAKQIGSFHLKQKHIVSVYEACTNRVRALYLIGPCTVQQCCADYVSYEVPYTHCVIYTNRAHSARRETQRRLSERY